ncbi:MAG: aconitate hydratase 1 [Deltaproteobacteria bacterium GWA2_45_12]|nr:MAG: aconitate hydratase 1 [Deltaproteobacteria bacterium GWA2_45_12]
MPSDSFKTKTTLSVNNQKYSYYSLPQLEKSGFKLKTLPYSIRVLVENLLRCEDGLSVSKTDIQSLLEWKPQQINAKEINFMPARVILQDFTGVPAVVDLAAMRDAIKNLGGDPQKINPLQPVELVIDHSVQVDASGNAEAFGVNARLEFERNEERYTFLNWGQKAFKNFKVVPPDTGIVHQVNLEFLARVVMVCEKGNEKILCPDTVVGTDSHTTMINGLGVLGWGVGGIEAEAAMLGQPCTMLIPPVVGFKLTGKLPEGATATDAVLTVTEMLRKKGVVGKFVEFFGPGAANLSLADRATIANMAPEYGATCGFFPVDDKTLDYLRLTGRKEEQINLVKTYLKAQDLFWTPASPQADYSDIIELDLGTIKPCLAGPSRPQDRVELNLVASSFNEKLSSLKPKETAPKAGDQSAVTLSGKSHIPQNGDVVIAAITSCTNTSNPSVLIAAGLVAKKAAEKGLVSQPWVKTSLAPGSQVVTEYLKKAGLLSSLEKLGFHVVGYGCTTCIGNSGPLLPVVSEVYRERGLVACSVLSGNRNFEGRVHADVRANYLASPPLVVAYAIAGTITRDLTKEAIGQDKSGKPIYLKDIWPTQEEIIQSMAACLSSKLFSSKYENVYAGDARWQGLSSTGGATYKWDQKSTYVQDPPYFVNMSKKPVPKGSLAKARILAIFGDSITTDHISPAGSIKASSPAGLYLQKHGIKPADFNSYGSRRGNHEVMMRGTFANTRIKNLMLEGIEGGMTKHVPTGETMPIFDAAMKYQGEKTALVVIAGKEYGSGSSRDWAAKGPALLGVRAVIAESYERIHRSNLVGMGVLPLQFKNGNNHQALKLTGDEMISIENLDALTPLQTVKVSVQKPDGSLLSFDTTCRIDTPVELEYYKHGGILKYVLRQLAGK